MDENPGSWTCTRCGALTASDLNICPKCGQAKTMKMRLPSFSEVNTESYIVPARREAIRAWLVVTAILTVTMGLTYVILKALW